MTTLRMGLALLAVGAVAAGAAALYQSQAVIGGEEDPVARQLRELRQQSAALNQDILKLRSGLYRNYDTLVIATQRMSDLVVGLNQATAKGVGQPNPAFAGLLRDFSADFESRRAQIERFKSKNAILRNSLFYFPKVADLTRKDADRLGSQALLRAAIDTLERDLLIYYIHGDAQLQPHLRTGMQELSQFADELPLELGSQVQLLIKHAAIVLSHKKAVDALVAEITDETSLALAENLHKSYLDENL